MKPDYTSPKWQKRRLEILNRDQFRCSICDDGEEQLHVHHTYYISGRHPADYPNWALATLCKTCHKERHDNEPDGLHDWEKVIDGLCVDPEATEVVIDLITALNALKKKIDWQGDLMHLAMACLSEELLK